MKIKIGLALTSFCFATSWLSTLPQAQAKNSSVELQAASASGQDASWVELNPLERKLVKSPNSEVSLQKLTASFVLANSQVKYELRYFVDNDWEYHGWKDPRQISAPYFAGLGFVKPNSNSWYYNAYINFKLDDFNAGQYAIKSIEEVVMPDGAARVDVLWDTP